VSVSGDPHGADPQEFLDEVHSFEFWFQAVEGYLHGHPYGHQPQQTEPALDPAEREALITTLCNYCVGETAALEGASGMISFAPNRRHKIFLATQVADEARHVEVLVRRLTDLGVADPEQEIQRRANHRLLTFRNRLLKFVYSRDWEAALFAQNVILECMEFTVFQAHARRSDPVTSEILEGLIKDERRHVGFGENELGRQLKATPIKRAHLQHIRTELDPLILHSFEELSIDLGMPASQRPELGRAYLAAVGRLGFGA